MYFWDSVRVILLICVADMCIIERFCCLCCFSTYIPLIIVLFSYCYMVVSVAFVRMLASYTLPDITVPVDWA